MPEIYTTGSWKHVEDFEPGELAVVANAADGE
jgi:hypothetical protein